MVMLCILEVGCNKRRSVEVIQDWARERLADNWEVSVDIIVLVYR
jgi:hypothetical protein